MKNYVIFQFHGETIILTERQFDQAVVDGLRCRCGDCLDCRAVEYSREAGKWPDECYEFITQVHLNHRMVEDLLRLQDPRRFSQEPCAEEDTQ